LLSILRKALRVSLSTERSGFADIAVSDLRLHTDAGPIPCRLYRSNPAGPAPLLIFFHGGGFITCDLETHDGLCRGLARAAGVQVLSVDYSLAPEAPYPRQLEEAVAISRWAVVHASTLGAKGAHVAVGGDSAGAYLAARAALAINERNPGRIRAQLLLYPLIQMDDAVWAHPTFSGGRIVGRFAARLMRNQLRGTYSSLLTENLSTAPPTLLVTGGPDPTRRDAEIFVKALRDSEVPVQVRHCRFLPHGGFNLLHLSGRARADLMEVGDMLGLMLTPRPSIPMPT
tara:strand:- start:3664 stop:4521 length:858 start_codon:yes stop_codon:yes gene_type:complete